MVSSGQNLFLLILPSIHNRKKPKWCSCAQPFWRFSQSPRSEEKPELEQESEERLTRTMRYHVSPTEKDETEEIIHRLSAAAKVTLTHSNIMRACRDILFQIEDRLLVEFTKARLRRPINDKRAIAFFESRLTEIIQTAIRQTPLVHNRSGR